MAWSLVSWKNKIEPTNDDGTAYLITVETTMRDGELLKTVVSQQTAADMAGVLATGSPKDIADTAVADANGA
jgi:hypothetical protein